MESEQLELVFFPLMLELGHSCDHCFFHDKKCPSFINGRLMCKALDKEGLCLGSYFCKIS